MGATHWVGDIGPTALSANLMICTSRSKKLDNIHALSFL
ncbi:hypothetical protein TR2A62_2488 [Thalassobium sp. R2A62]|nr:hypothetical protein TR2A62_2488 [Thalassobium sp. R2A62]